MPTKPAALPTLTDHAPFAPVAAKMMQLENAYATARQDCHKQAEACRANDTGGRFEPSDSAVSRCQHAERVMIAAKEARTTYAHATYNPAHRAAVAVVVPAVLAGVWGPALKAVLAKLEAAVAELAKAVALRAELEAVDLFHLPVADALPAVELFGDPADEWSPLGKLRAAVRDLDDRPAN